MNNPFLVLVIFGVLAMALQYTLLCWCKHFGDWNDQIRLHENGIMPFMHPVPPLLTLLGFLLSAIFYLVWG